VVPSTANEVDFRYARPCDEVEPRAVQEYERGRFKGFRLGPNSRLPEPETRRVYELISTVRDLSEVFRIQEESLCRSNPEMCRGGSLWLRPTKPKER
jgi:hypothetical protein